MIYKNTENSTQELHFFPIKGKNIELSGVSSKIKVKSDKMLI
jgi:hypothetical protein